MIVEVQAEEKERSVWKDNKSREQIKWGERETEWGWSGLIGFQVIVCLLNILIHDVII